MKKPTKEAINEFLTRGVQDVIDRDKLAGLLLKGPIRAYLGIDPTGSEIHLGHAIALRKLRKLQDWGHHVVLLIGDFTAMIGDPTGKDEMRKQLTSEEVLANAEDYQKQAAKILRFDGESPVELKYNSQWLAKMSFGEVVDLAANFTVQQMLERDMFQRRIKEGKPISLHEFLYPLMQGYDTVAMDMDLEIGGNDQLFNMLAGRTLKQKLRNEEKHVMTMALLEGSDGRKMSKTFNNHIPISAEPNDMYGRVMSIKDELIIQYFKLATDVEMDKIDQMEEEMMGGANPRDLKMELAREIVTMYHDKKSAKDAEKAFIDQFQKGGKPEEIKKIPLTKSEWDIVHLLVQAQLASTKSDARRLVEQGAVRFNDKVVKDITKPIKVKTGDIIQKGKRGFKEFVVE